MENDKNVSGSDNATNGFADNNAPPPVPTPAPPVPEPAYPPAPQPPQNPSFDQPLQTPPEQKTNVSAIAGFILSFLVSVVGVVVSIIALRRIKKTGEKGKGLAIAGVVVGSVVTATAVVLILVATLLVSTLSETISGNYTCGSLAQSLYSSSAKAQTIKIEIKNGNVVEHRADGSDRELGTIGSNLRFAYGANTKDDELIINKIFPLVSFDYVYEADFVPAAPEWSSKNRFGVAKGALTPASQVSHAIIFSDGTVNGSNVLACEVD
jgi:hypothetical protein